MLVFVTLLLVYKDTNKSLIYKISIRHYAGGAFCDTLGWGSRVAKGNTAWRWALF